MDNVIKEATDLINKSSKIIIASHVSPDGDSLGSSLALGLALEKIDKEAVVLKSDIIPEDFKFLPGASSVKEYNNSLGDIDLFIALDCGDEDRLGGNKELFKKSKKVLNIDHHVSNTNFGDINIVDSEAAATGELIYDLIVKLNIEIDENIAENLYTAISTDTGSFKYDSTTAKTHRIIANLLDVGIDKSKININLYESMSFTKMQLLSKAFTTLETFNNNEIAIMEVTQDMLKETGATMEDAEGIITFIKNLDTVEVACLFKENKEKEIKISLRTKKDIDGSKICSKFGGGGHERAAGCTIKEDIHKAKSIMVTAIQEDMRE